MEGRFGGRGCGAAYVLLHKQEQAEWEARPGYKPQGSRASQSLYGLSNQHCQLEWPGFQTPEPVRDNLHQNPSTIQSKFALVF